MEIPADYAQINLVWGGAGAPHGSEVTLGLNIELSALDPTETCDEVIVQYLAAGFDALMVNTVTLTAVRCKFGPNATGPSAEVFTTQPGTASGGGVSPNVTLLCKKITGFGGRTGRGRWYWPGLGEANVDSGGFIDAGHLTNWQTAFDDFHTGMIGEGLVPALLHAPGSPVSSPMLITSFQADGRAATQRRRLRP